MTRECLAVIRETTEDYEVIIVDNGSTPPIAKPYMGFVDVTMIRNETNLGFPAAVNQACRVAKGDVIVLLNNDVTCTPQWASRLEAHLKRFSIVGPLSNYCAGRQATTVQGYYDKDSLFNVATELSEARNGLAMEVNWVIGFCFAFRSSLFKEIGEFDESIWPSSGEEIDFCYRAKAAGHSIGIAQDVYVHHEGHQTFKDMEADGSINLQELFKITTDHVMDKWGVNFWNEQVVRGVMMEGGLRLNLGCGKPPWHLKGFVNVDQDPGVQPDLVCDILDLPYEEETVDEIYAGHILEHFDWKEGEVALQYWLTLLKPGGKISVVVPDFDYLAKEYLVCPSPLKLREFNDMYIYSYCQKSPHKYAYSADLLREAMESVGFGGLKRMTEDNSYFPLPVKWQAGFEAVKP
jgi:predicted SAM-dependent methyltransferase